MSVSAPPKMTEAQLEAAIIEAARWAGWMVHHCRPAVRQSGAWSTPISGDRGFPDLVMVRQGRLIFAELKATKGRMRPEQWDWIGRLTGTRAEVYVWRPEDLRKAIETLMGRVA